MCDAAACVCASLHLCWWFVFMGARIVISMKIRECPFNATVNAICKTAEIKDVPIHTEWLGFCNKWLYDIIDLTSR